MFNLIIIILDFLNKLRISIKHVLYNNVFHNFTTLQAGIITAHFHDRENSIKRSSFTESLSFDAFNGQKARGNRINSREYHAAEWKFRMYTVIHAI